MEIKEEIIDDPLCLGENENYGQNQIDPLSVPIKNEEIKDEIELDDETFIPNSTISEEFSSKDVSQIEALDTPKINVTKPNENLKIAHEKSIENTCSYQYMCDLCGKSFLKKDNLTKHVSFAHLDKDLLQKHLCSFCGKEFSCKRYLNRHIKIHGDGKKYENKEKHCDMCDKSFLSKGGLINHKLKHEGKVKTTKCEICCIEVQNILMHMNIKHENATNVNCGVCGIEFSGLKALNGHKLRVHIGQSFKCEICGKSFSHMQTLKIHIGRDHTNQNKFQCLTCKKSFMQPQTLKHHMATIHEGLRKFKCEYCNKKFGNKSHMKDHIFRRHRNEIPLYDLEGYSCNICDRIFANGQDLTRHKGSLHN